MPGWVGRAVWRGIWQLIAAVLITAAALWFAGRASDLIGYLILAQLLAFALEPAVLWLHQRRGWRRGSATGLLLVAIVLLFVVLGVGMGAVLADQFDEAAGQLPVWIDKLNAFTQEHFDTTLIPACRRGRLGAGDPAAQQAISKSMPVTSWVRLGSALGAVFSLFTLGMFTFYLTADGPKVRQVLLSRLPPYRQRNLLWAWNTAIDKTGGYLYSRGLLAVINGVLIFVTIGDRGHAVSSAARGVLRCGGRVHSYRGHVPGGCPSRHRHAVSGRIGPAVIVLARSSSTSSSRTS